MKKWIVSICLLWILLGMFDLPYISDVLWEMERAWTRAWYDIAPFLADINLNTLAYVISLFLVASESFGRQDRIPGLLSLRKHALTENDEVLSITSRTPSSTTAFTHDYLEDICFVERRFNGSLLIILVGLLCLIPGALFATQSDLPATGIPFLLLAIVLVIVLMKGRLIVGTADGSRMNFSTNKLTAQKIVDLIAQPEPSAFHEVSLSNPFVQRTLLLRAARITGVVSISRFPVLAFLLLLLSTAGAYTVYEDAPVAIGLPVVLLMIVILLARKRTAVKLIGGHYRVLGTREKPSNLLVSATPAKRAHSVGAPMPPRPPKA